MNIDKVSPHCFFGGYQDLRQLASLALTPHKPCLVILSPHRRSGKTLIDEELDVYG